MHSGNLIGTFRNVNYEIRSSIGSPVETGREIQYSFYLMSWCKWHQHSSTNSLIALAMFYLFSTPFFFPWAVLGFCSYQMGGELEDGSLIPFLFSSLTWMVYHFP